MHPGAQNASECIFGYFINLQTSLVKDTGSGMTKEQLRDLSERMKKGQPSVSEGSGGFGLVNVNLRIRLYYNQTDGLKIESGAEGTEVSFRVPCRTREEIFENDETEAAVKASLVMA